MGNAFITGQGVSGIKEIVTGRALCGTPLPSIPFASLPKLIVLSMKNLQNNTIWGDSCVLVAPAPSPTAVSTHSWIIQISQVTSHTQVSINVTATGIAFINYGSSANILDNTNLAIDYFAIL